MANNKTNKSIEDCGYQQLHLNAYAFLEPCEIHVVSVLLYRHIYWIPQNKVKNGIHWDLMNQINCKQIRHKL